MNNHQAQLARAFARRGFLVAVEYAIGTPDDELRTRLLSAIDAAPQCVVGRFPTRESSRFADVLCALYRS